MFKWTRLVNPPSLIINFVGVVAGITYAVNSIPSLMKINIALILGTILLLNIGELWKKTIFPVATLLALMSDMTFLYIPTVHWDLKCFRLTSSVRIVALLFRSVVDMVYIIELWFSWRSCSPSRSGSRRKSKLFMILNFFTVLPFPHIAILVLFNRFRGWEYPTNILMYSLILVQYILRIIHVYVAFFSMQSERAGNCLKMIASLIIYIATCHTFGGFYYMFALEQLASYWNNACIVSNRCVNRDFVCSDSSSQNEAILTELCPLNGTDPGMFYDITIGGALWSESTMNKFANCFWWGLRHLTSQGANLVTNSSTYQNLVACTIAVTSVLLIAFLLASMQYYIRFDIQKWEDYQHMMRVERKQSKKLDEMKVWLKRNGVPTDLIIKLLAHPEVLAKVDESIIAGRDIAVQYLLPRVSLRIQRLIEHWDPLCRLKRVLDFENLDDGALHDMRRCLHRVEFKRGTTLLRENEPFPFIFLLVEGEVRLTSSKASDHRIGSGQFVYGENAFFFAIRELGLLERDIYENGIISMETMISVTDVEAMILEYRDLKNIIRQFWSLPSRRTSDPVREKSR